MSADAPLRLSPISDETELRKAYSTFPSGVVAVCCDLDGEPTGMAASAFSTVSLDPPLVSLCVQNTSSTWPRLRAASAIGVSVFASDQESLCRRLAGPAAQRFATITPHRGDDGALFIPGAAAAMSCTLHSEVPAGDHVLVLLRIEALRADVGVEPLVFHASSFRALEARPTAS